MKKIILSILFIFSSTLNAQDMHDWALGINASFNVPGGERGAIWQNGTGFGITIEKFIYQMDQGNLDLAFSTGFTSWPAVANDQGTGVNNNNNNNVGPDQRFFTEIIPTRLALKYYVGQKNFNPFANIGLGYAYSFYKADQKIAGTRNNYQRETNEESFLFYDIGVGVRSSFARNFKVDISINYQMFPEDIIGFNNLNFYLVALYTL